MALSIRRQSVEEKARRYAALRQITVTDAIEEALDSKLEQQDRERERKKQEFFALVRRIQDEVAKLPRINEHLTDDEIIGYDENGLPA